MKKTRALISLLSLLLLTSCGGGVNPDSSVSVSGNDSTTNEVTTQDNTVEGSSTIVSNEGASNITTTDLTTTSVEDTSSEGDESLYDVTLIKGESKWTATENEVFENAFGIDGGYIPYIGKANYEFEYLTEYQCVSVSAEGSASDLTSYEKAAKALGYIIEEDSWYESSYYAYGYYNENGNGITINYYLGTDESGSGSYICLDIYHHKYIEPESIRTEWTATEKSALDTAYGTGIADMVPCFIPEGCELVDGTEDYGMFYVYYMNGGVPEVNTVCDLLEKAGFTYDADFDEYVKPLTETKAIYASGYLDIYGEFYYTIQVYDENEGGGEGGEGGGETDTEVEGDWYINASSISSLTQKTQYTLSSFELNGVSYACANFTYNTQGGRDVLQFKKKEGYLYNTTPLATGLDKIEISVNSSTYGEGAITVFSSTDGQTWTEVAGTNNVYDFNGETYFKLANLSANAVYLNTVAFTNVK